MNNYDVMLLRRWVVGLLIFGFCVLVDKMQIIQLINKSLPYKPAVFLSGMLLGDKGSYTKEIYENLKNSGLLHLVVVSSSNLTLLIGGMVGELSKLVGRKWAAMVGIILGWKYVLLVDWEIPIVRAMLLLTIFFVAQLWGRKFDIWRAVVLVVVIMMLAEWSVVLDIGFWLSILSFVAVVIFDQMFRIRFGWLEILLKTIWINIWILPILALFFGKISWLAPITNLMVLFLVEYITIVGMVGSLVGLVFFELGKIIIWLCVPALVYMERVVEMTGVIDVWKFNFNWWMLAGYYFILGYFVLKKY